MAEAATAAPSGWAGPRRRRRRPARLVATLLLHALVLGSLQFEAGRVRLPRPGSDRTTTLVEVTLPPVQRRAEAIAHPLPAPAHAVARARGRAANARDVHAHPPARPDTTPAASPPAPGAEETPPPPPLAAVAAQPASGPPRDALNLDSAATRQAIRDAARGDTAAGRGNALAHEDPGSELLAANGAHVGTQRRLPPLPPAQQLAHDLAAAHKPDCMKGEYPGGGMGLLSAPFLLVAEAMGSCAHKL